jgi:hypothetical protein
MVTLQEEGDMLKRMLKRLPRLRVVRLEELPEERLQEIERRCDALEKYSKSLFCLAFWEATNLTIMRLVMQGKMEFPTPETLEQCTREAEPDVRNIMRHLDPDLYDEQWSSWDFDWNLSLV